MISCPNCEGPVISTQCPVCECRYYICLNCERQIVDEGEKEFTVLRAGEVLG